jgi:diguanylate cyclase (GGDEF)-like protein/PAS domain S-box-containing protein
MSEYKFSNSDLLTIINSSPVGMLLVNEKGLIKFSNLKAQTIFSYQEKEILDLHIDCLVPDRHQAKHSEKMHSYMENPSPRAMGAGRVLPALMKDGSETLIEIGLVPIELRGHELILVSTIEASNKVLKVASYHDPLTGLPNRNLFLELSENLRKLAIRNQAKLTVMFVDLDWFKQVNDSYGHDTGDLVLIEVARILQKNVRKNDVVGRMGGDEFIISMYDIEDKLSIEKITYKLIDEISNMCDINNHSINISASIGAVIASNPKHFYLDQMINKSDKLMYQVKKSGKGKAVCEEF